MGGENGDRKRKGWPEWAEWDREQGKGGSGASGAGSGERRAKGLRWSVMCRSTGYSTLGRVPIRFGTCIIRNGWNGGLESTLRSMSQANLEMGIFQETKLTA